jgi:hypothetical protein
MADAPIALPAPDAADRDVVKRLQYLHAIHSKLLNGMPKGLSWFPDIHVHINAALRATREQIAREQSGLPENQPNG